MLSDAQIERYSRQLILPEVGPAGQQRLLDGGVAVVRSTAGDAAFTYLAAAGVGRIGLIDAPHHDSPLAELADSNSDVTIEAIAPDDSAERTWRPYALVIDASNSSAHHENLSRVCLTRRRPVLLGTLRDSVATIAMVIGPGPNSPCFACIASELEVSVRDDSALSGATAFLLGSLLAAEALKYLLGVGSSLADRQLTYDLRCSRFEYAPIARRIGCPVCGGA